MDNCFNNFNLFNKVTLNQKVKYTTTITNPFIVLFIFNKLFKYYFI